MQFLRVSSRTDKGVHAQHNVSFLDLFFCFDDSVFVHETDVLARLFTSICCGESEMSGKS